MTPVQQQARNAAADIAYPDIEGKRLGGHNAWGLLIRSRRRYSGKPATGNNPAAWRQWTDDDSRQAIEGAKK